MQSYHFFHWCNVLSSSGNSARSIFPGMKNHHSDLPCGRRFHICKTDHQRIFARNFCQLIPSKGTSSTSLSPWPLGSTQKLSGHIGMKPRLLPSELSLYNLKVAAPVIVACTNAQNTLLKFTATTISHLACVKKPNPSKPSV